MASKIAPDRSLQANGASLPNTFQTIQPVWRRTRERSLTCPICFDPGIKTLLLEIPSHLPPNEVLSLYHCQICRTGFFHPIKSADYSTVLETIFTADFGIEQGTGLASMIRNVCMLKQTKSSHSSHSLLDVGCGSGFLVDFASRVLGWDAAGVDLSAAATQGKKLLGANLYEGYLKEVPELRERQFDVIHASEVIEHVEDPRAFLAELKTSLAPGGVLVLTTPDADSLTESLTLVTLIACLSPGFHTIIFSEFSLKKLLAESGYSYIKVIKFGHQLLAYASDKEFDVDLQIDIRPPMFQYLDLLASQDSLPTRLAMGVSYRSLKEHINSGDYEACPAAFVRAAKVMKNAYGVAIDDFDQIQKRLTKSENLQALGETLPYCICSLLYFAGMYQLLCVKDNAAARDYFAACFESCLYVIPLCPAVFEEAALLFWHAKFHEGFAQLLLNDNSAAIETIRLIVDQAQSGHQKLPEVKPSPTLLASCLHQLGMAHFLLREYTQAIGYYERVLSDYSHAGEEGVLQEARKHLNMARKHLDPTGESGQDNTENNIRNRKDTAASEALLKPETANLMADDKGKPMPNPKPMRVHYRIDNTWSDDYGVAVQGWIFGAQKKLDKIEITIDGVTVPVDDWHARPDVVPFYPDLNIPRECGFWVHVPRRAQHSIGITASQNGSTWSKTELKRSPIRCFPSMFLVLT